MAASPYNESRASTNGSLAPTVHGNVSDELAASAQQLIDQGTQLIIEGQETVQRGQQLIAQGESMVADGRKALELEDDAPKEPRKSTIPMKIFGALSLLFGIGAIPIIVLIILGLIGTIITSGASAIIGSITVVTFVEALVFSIMGIGEFIFGIRLLRNKRRGAAQAAYLLVLGIVITLLMGIMLYGMNWQLIPYAVYLVFILAFQSYIDPTLTQERDIHRKLGSLEAREQAKAGTLGLDPSGKGYIRLNFFNLFWIFVVCSVIGLGIEMIYCGVVNHVVENRAGLLWGPFSPIYGVGGVLMTLALNRFHHTKVVVVFLVSAVVGGAFEYLASWFWEAAFGIVAWDYSGMFLSIGGRTCGLYMAMWGLLGVVWIKAMLPWLLRLVNRIPWNWRYSVTTLCALAMAFDIGMTMITLDCWYQRQAGIENDSFISTFCEQHYDDAFMESRFETMHINPDRALRS